MKASSTTPPAFRPKSRCASSHAAPRDSSTLPGPPPPPPLLPPLTTVRPLPLQQQQQLLLLLLASRIVAKRGEARARRVSALLFARHEHPSTGTIGNRNSTLSITRRATYTHAPQPIGALSGEDHFTP